MINLCKLKNNLQSRLNGTRNINPQVRLNKGLKVLLLPYLIGFFIKAERLLRHHFNLYKMKI
jgi:hypothetical protein